MIDPKMLCKKHLLGEHVELHSIASIILNKKEGYSKHPETKRWRGHVWALRMRHSLIVSEMKLRGYNHKSPIRYISNINNYSSELFNLLLILNC